MVSPRPWRVIQRRASYTELMKFQRKKRIPFTLKGRKLIRLDLVMSEVAQICYRQGGFQSEQKAINLQTPILPLARSKEERLARRVTKTALQSGVY